LVQNLRFPAKDGNNGATINPSYLLFLDFEKKIENEMKRVFSSHAIPPFFLSPSCSRGLRGGRGLLGQMTRKNVEEKKH
jgi:hypothetical protein